MRKKNSQKGRLPKAWRVTVEWDNIEKLDDEEFALVMDMLLPIEEAVTSVPPHPQNGSIYERFSLYRNTCRLATMAPQLNRKTS